MLGRDKVVLEVRCLFEGVFEQLIGGARQRRLGRASARDFGQLLDRRHGLRLDGGHLQAHAFQQGSDDALVVLQQRRQNVDRLQLRITVLAGDVVRPLHRLLGLYG